MRSVIQVPLRSSPFIADSERLGVVEQGTLQPFDHLNGVARQRP